MLRNLVTLGVGACRLVGLDPDQLSLQAPFSEGLPAPMARLGPDAQERAALPLRSRLRLGTASIHHFSNGDGVVIRPEWEVDEDSSLGGSSHPSHLLRGKAATSSSSTCSARIAEEACKSITAHAAAAKLLSRLRGLLNCIDALVKFVIKANGSHKRR
jgi:hypothetical protein